MGRRGDRGQGREQRHHQRRAEQKTQLPIEVPHGTGVGHVLGRYINKGGVLCGTAAQAATEPHQGIQRHRQQRVPRLQLH